MGEGYYMSYIILPSLLLSLSLVEEVIIIVIVIYRLFIINIPNCRLIIIEQPK